MQMRPYGGNTSWLKKKIPSLRKEIFVPCMQWLVYWKSARTGFRIWSRNIDVLGVLCWEWKITWWRTQTQFYSTGTTKAGGGSTSSQFTEHGFKLTIPILRPRQKLYLWQGPIRGPQVLPWRALSTPALERLCPLGTALSLVGWSTFVISNV